MVEKFFLSLDYETSGEALAKGLEAVETLRAEFGNQFVRESVGVKINQDLLTDGIDPRHTAFATNGHDVFADLKIAHGYDTGERILKRVVASLPIKFATISAGLGSTILSEYVKAGRQLGVNIVAFTAHTKIPAPEVRAMYQGETLDDVICNLGSMAAQAGCDSIVLEAERLRNERIRSLPVKKLVTGIRVDPADRGTQSRVTSLGDLAQLKEHVDYVVVSSRYLGNPAALKNYFAALL